MTQETTTPSVLQFHASTKPVLHPEVARFSAADVEALFALPFNDLLYRAQTVHREHFDPNSVQLSTLLSIKTGGCTEDCSYCPQSSMHDTGVENQEMLALNTVLDAAKAAKAAGAGRFCMGAAWRGPSQDDLASVLEMVKAVKAMGLETCATLGMLKSGQAEQLRDAGLDYYNHNLDTAPEKYGDIISSRDYEDRLDTLNKVRQAGINVCCGGIVGLGEERLDRAGLLAQLANLEPQPESVPINNLVQVEGTPLDGTEPIDWTEFVRTIAVARILMPKSYVRLSAGRQQMPEAMQAMCFMAGANSIFYGEKLLTTGNPDVSRDQALLAKLNINAASVTHTEADLDEDEDHTSPTGGCGCGSGHHHHG
ncbi:biotin synthase BioB [Leeia oryzae]|uniref:biotin synthase BioB n=1 Tax=Leeia oryzae TaxID=356662 RepID=UPI00037E41AE|nr:biotin synthase BioB [Leeia oryzae]